MLDLIKDSLLLGLGLAVLTKEKFEGFMEELVKKGKMTKEEGSKFVKELLEKGEKERVEIEKFLKEQVRKLIEKANLPTADQLKNLEVRLEGLEGRVKELEGKLT